MRGNVINNRTQVEIMTPGATNTIPLTGADLAMFEDAITYRLLTVWGTYPSPSAGSDLAFRQQIQFPIRPMVG
jgi:hypothetical protein